ncbi:MAG TPA: aspartate--tRNA ligase [Candidatus Kapabacteria bacterium]|nr:aspartate--tRNA ligase [Candidatus Kapabacteria bacterium]
MDFKKRNKNCGQLRSENVNENVILNGWVASRRDLGGLIFIDLRDRYGITQIVIEPENRPDLAERAKEIRSEFVLWVDGVIRERSSPNKNIPTGMIELLVSDFSIINKSELPPFEIADNIETNEELKLKYRFLDLRRPELQSKFIIRNKFYQIVHNYFYENGFLEVETPILMKSTPEGARDFLVPSRINKGRFYALPQSPQLFKQILMISGFDRYMQIVKCFRDEDLRSDRQSEFTQIDIEMSFIEQDDIFNLIEGLMYKTWKEILNVEIKAPFLRMTWEEAMTKYGSDKPDLRFNMPINEVTEIVRNSNFKVFQDIIAEGGTIQVLNAQNCSEFSRKQIDGLSDLAKKYGAKGLAWIKVLDSEVNSPISKFLSDEEMKAILQKCSAKAGDLLLISSDKKYKALNILGNVRIEVAKVSGLYEKIKNNFSFHWVVDFPLFEWDEDTQRYYAMHHPFTSPMPEDMQFLDSEPNKVRARAYDLVVNGAELGGGSIRIHDNIVQQKMFDKLGLSEQEIEEKFGFFIKALKYGVPPHGGVALGLDRIVMTLSGTDNIRDVIAFPKTTSGLSLMDGAPSGVSEEQLKELALKIIE